jgi:hypothetical protein
MGRPKKGDNTPRQSGRKQPKADHSEQHRLDGESRREQRERLKAAEAAGSPWVILRKTVREKGEIEHAELEELAGRVAQGGISLVDCSISALLLEVDAEEMRYAGELTNDRAITVQRQLLKLKLDIAREYQSQGDPLPSSIKVELVTSTEEPALPQAGETGDELVVH